MKRLFFKMVHVFSSRKAVIVASALTVLFLFLTSLLDPLRTIALVSLLYFTKGLFGLHPKSCSDKEENAMVEMFVQDIEQCGELSKAIESTYGLARKGR